MEFAYTLYVDATCPICGGNKFECRNEANRGLYEIADTTCHRQAAVEEYTGQDKFKPEPGQRFYATEIDSELITRRTFGGAVSVVQIPDTNNGQPDKKNNEAD